MSEPVPYPVLNDDEPIRQFNELDASLTYSYANYLNWLFPERVELIAGKIFKMSPAPSRAHQEVAGRIFLKIGNFLKGKQCKIYSAPFDVRFPKESKADKNVYTVLQPDICVICDKSKLDARGCIGAPDLVVEILSPGNTKTELLHKYRIYEEFGVKEYWVVSHGDQSILIYTLNEMGKFEPSKIFALSEKITSTVLPGFELALDDIFEDVD
ncbi:Endonuclease, Uma2 family (restriction endonuclease fold) [Pedobacter suwonensis]|uniref:Endonuclease, Uma2 family (Restriction endonuclease fold) n=1 Tax=Pedobacter suwonensis TaxID=332999 RepID=A0A1I0TP53_9SPHI|nr:Uma2 family endonuclease [Pedobacter suwonensis]SFA53522.1 Endonuclease, Uma2 family (restriction endonuclease fold) [Pedobacter suwonensis]